MSDDMINDRRLSFHALGIMAHVLRDPTRNYIGCQELMMFKGDLSNDEVMDAIGTLVACGYLRADGAFWYAM